MMRFGYIFKSMLLLASLSALLVLIGALLGGQGGMIVALAFAVLMNMGAWWFSDKLALKMSGAHPVTREQAPDLHATVETLAARAGLPKPGVYIIDSDTPNAFATGRSPDKGVVAVTSGIMRILDRDELAGVIAHELAHIKHRDTLIASIAATVAGAITMLANMAQWALMFGGLGGNDDDEGNGLAELAGNLVLIIVAPLAAVLIQMAISRSREFLADEGGARILGNPLPLARALQKLEMGVAARPMQANPASSHLYIMHPFAGGGLLNLFRTHPATGQRIARLEALARQPQGMTIQA